MVLFFVGWLGGDLLVGVAFFWAIGAVAFFLGKVVEISFADVSLTEAFVPMEALAGVFTIWAFSEGIFTLEASLIGCFSDFIARLEGFCSTFWGATLGVEGALLVDALTEVDVVRMLGLDAGRLGLSFWDGSLTDPAYVDAGFVYVVDSLAEVA